MKRGFLVVGGVTVFSVALGFACGGSTAQFSGTSGGSQPGPASSDSSGTTTGPGDGADARSGDAGDEGGLPPDGGVPIDASCPLPVSPDPAGCVHDSDCTIVLEGCYCGRQPAIGIAKPYNAAATACEAKAAATCARGCVSQAGQVAQDGRTSADGTIAVHCVISADGGSCNTYVP